MGYIVILMSFTAIFPSMSYELLFHYNDTELILFLFLSYRKDRARHEQLARERLAALKAKRAEKEAAIIVSNEDEQRHAIEAKLQDEQDKEKDILSQEALELQQGGVVAVHEAILKEVEKKHSIEIKVLIYQHC
jgi:hypothetical protein